MPSTKEQQRRDKASYQGWDLWLAPQDPENPAFRYESESDLPCREPESQEAARAGLEFEEAAKSERVRLLQALVESARKQPLTLPRRNEVERIEHEIDVLLLGNSGAQEKQQKLRQLRATYRGCSQSLQNPLGFVCCFGFADKSRTPLLVGTLKKEQIAFKLDNDSVCVRQRDDERVAAFQLALP